jgi:hypothetical protein
MLLNTALQAVPTAQAPREAGRYAENTVTAVAAVAAVAAEAAAAAAARIPPPPPPPLPQTRTQQSKRCTFPVCAAELELSGHVAHCGGFSEPAGGRRWLQVPQGPRREEEFLLHRLYSNNGARQQEQ